MAPLAPELCDFVASGVSILVGTRDPDLAPDCVRALGVRVEDGGRALTVFVPQATGARAVANLRATGRAAVMFSRMLDHRTFQVKGAALAVAEAGEADRAVVDAYRAAFSARLGEVGVPARDSLRMAHWPAWAVRVAVEAVFAQTPGPGAGAPLGPPEGRA